MQDTLMGRFQERDFQKKLYKLVAGLKGRDAKSIAHQMVVEYVKGGHSQTLERLKSPDSEQWERIPVKMEQFLSDPFFLGDVENLRDLLRDDLIALFDTRQYAEAVIDGSIGWGKSTFVGISFTYMAYQLSCLVSPQAYYGIMPGSVIYLVNQSVNLKLAKNVVFGEIKARVNACPYFQEVFRYDPQIQSELRFPKNIVILPLASDNTSALGLNVYGGCLDEVNFLPKVRNSVHSRTVGEEYDHAQKLYKTIARRIKSRFMMRGGGVPGKIILISSSQYPDDFTEQRKKKAVNDDSIFVRTHSLWEAQKDKLCGKNFKIEVGGDFGRSRMLPEKYDQASITGRIIDVPVEYRIEFESDIEDAVRDIAGLATSTINPFIPSADWVKKCTDSKREHPFSMPETNLRDGVRLIPDRIAEKVGDKWQPRWYPKEPRFCHIDYALTSDEAGLAVGCAGQNVKVERMGIDGAREEMNAPIIHIDFMLRIVPPKGGEIDLENVRTIALGLRKYGFRFKCFTFDSFQSAEAKQQLRKLGIDAEQLSVDTDITPYMEVKYALREYRMRIYPYQPFKDEASTLEIDRERGKVDHPPGKDKGVTDAVAGVTMKVVEHRLAFREMFFV